MRVATELASIGRHLIGGFGTANYNKAHNNIRGSKYMPHQGKQEMARRVRQAGRTV